MGAPIRLSELVTTHIFGIRGIKDEEDFGGQMPTEAFDFIEGQVGAGRIIGIGQKDNLGARCDGAEDRADIGRIVAFRHHDWPTARAQDRITED